MKKGMIVQTVFVLVVMFAVCVTGLAGEQVSDLVPPECLWADGFTDTSDVSVIDKVELHDGAVRLRWQKGRKAAYVDKDSAVVKSGGWGEGNSCSTKGGKLTYKFNGDIIKIHARRGRDMGIYELWIDGKLRKRVDRSISITQWADPHPVTIEGLGYGDHVVEVIVTGEKNEQSTGTKITVRAFESHPTGFCLQGQVISAPIIVVPDRPYRWGKLHYRKTVPEGTSLVVDVLDSSGKVVISDVQDGVDLSSVKTPVIKLRATMSTTNPLVSPSLDCWSVAFTTEAQTEGGVTGCVLVGDGNPLGGATVVASEHGKEKARTKTSDSGAYCFKDLAAGEYEIQARADGFLPSLPAAVEVPCRRTVGFQLHKVGDVEQSKYTVWVAPPMLNIFKDFKPDHGTKEKIIRMEAARNEYEPAQFAVTAQKPLGPVSVRLGPLVHGDGGYTIGTERMEWNFVGYIKTVGHIKGQRKANNPDILRKIPCELPDVLLPDHEISINAGQTQPVWITVKVPTEAPAGDYTGTVEVLTPHGTQSIPIRLHVWPFALTDESHTWMGHGCSCWSRVIARYRNSDTDEERWRIIKMCIKNRAEHRENAIYTDHSLLGLTKVTVAEDGTWRFDFSRLDRWIETVLSFYPHGKAMLEFGCLASCSRGTDQVFFHGYSVWNEDGSLNKEHSIGHVEADSPEFKKFAKQFFGGVEKHLEEKGWLDNVCTRLADEPNKTCCTAYNRFADIVHEAAPKLRRFESVGSTGFAGHLEILNAIMSTFHKNMDYFLDARKPGQDVWFYTCCGPRGPYPSRHADFPLIKTRIVEWMVYNYQIHGYDRYGWACWHGDPYRPHCDFYWGPGDNCAVYPDPEKKRLFNSLRWEMMRESMEDYEYLWTLSDSVGKVAKKLDAADGEFDPRAPALELCAKAARSCTDFERNPDKLMALRREIAGQIVQTGSRPLVLLKTNPDGRAAIEPSTVKLFGLTEKGASVEINGQKIAVDPGGRFYADVSLSINSPEIKTTVRVGNDTKTLLKRFSVRKAKESK